MLHTLHTLQTHARGRAGGLYGDHMDRLFTVCYLPLCLLLLVLMVQAGPAVADPHTRITASFASFIALCAAVPLVGALGWEGGIKQALFWGRWGAGLECRGGARRTRWGQE
eukprot:365234-Chlamydomonas_euryale.AAC.4